MEEIGAAKRKRTDSGSSIEEITNKKTAIIENANDDDDCIILEQQAITINLDTTIEKEITLSPKSNELSSIETNNKLLNGDSVTVSTGDVAECSGFLFSVHFQNNQIFTELNKCISRSIQDVLFKLQKPVKVTENDETLQITVTLNEEPDDGCMFIVDSTPTEVDNAKAKDVPKYKLNVSNVLKNDPNVQIDETQCKRPARPKNTCFNCDGDHSMRDCTEKKDMAKIRKNRSNYGTGKTERYHVDADQRFGHFSPGILSAELRSALGLRKKDLPLHIYKMRECGYPPGWLEDAKVSKSGLALFDATVKSIYKFFFFI